MGLALAKLLKQSDPYADLPVKVLLPKTHNTLLNGFAGVSSKCCLNLLSNLEMAGLTL
jgi:hypothetical protein